MLRRIFLALTLLFATLPAFARETPAERIANRYAAHELASHPLHSNLPDYALPPAILTQALALGRLRITLFLAGTALAIAIPWLLLATGFVARTRDALARIPAWLAAPLILIAFSLAIRLVTLPLSIYAHHIGLAYNLSVQRWPGWFLDQAKGFALNALGLLILAPILYLLLRSFPRTWWLLAWCVLAPIVFFGVMSAPVALDPLFNRFEPLTAHHADLAAQLTRMGVPADRQFLMFASAKLTTPNAYVTGLGPTKRIVVWDTEFAHGNTVTPATLWTIGHECGHYALNHVLRGTLITIAAMLPALWLIAFLLLRLLTRTSSTWRITSLADPAALTALLFIANILSIAATPISNAISRSMEHDADIYGQEAIRSLVPDPQAAVRAACLDMGTRTFDDPNPAPWVEFLLDNHPTTSRRAAFATAYNPWAPGLQPKFITNPAAAR